MGKIGRILGTALTVVGAAAATAASFGAAAPILGLTLAQAATVASVAGGVLSAVTAKRPSNERQGQQLQFKVDPDGPIPYLMGRTATGGTIVHRVTYGTDNHYQTFFTVLSGGGPIAGFEAFTADRVLVPLGGAGGTSALGFYANWMWQDQQRGLTPEPEALTSGVVNPPYGTAGPVPNWGASYGLSGYAAASWTLLFDTKARRYSNGEPVAGWVLRGALCYDPRLDSTYPGGSGPCRWADPRDVAAHAAARATWVYSETPALQSLMWKLGVWQRQEQDAGSVYKRILGIGARIALIDVAAHIYAANVQELNGWKVGGQVDSGMDRWQVLKLIDQAGGAEPVASGALLSILQKGPRVSLGKITRADLGEGKITLPGYRRSRERINGFRARFRSEEHGWEMVPIDLVQFPALVAADGKARSGSDDYALVQQKDQAAELAAYEVLDSREVGRELPLKPMCIDRRIGDCWTLDIPELGLSEDVIVRGRSIDPVSFTLSATFVTETRAKHDLALGRSAIVPPAPALAIPGDEVPAPAVTDWVAAGATLAANGASIPAVIVTGIVGNTNADAVVFDYRPYIAGQGSEANWSAASLDAPTTTRKEFTGVTPNTRYEIGIRYRVRGVIGTRRILEAVKAGVFATSAETASLIQNSAPIQQGFITSSDTGGGKASITIGAHTRRYGDKDVAVAGATLTNLSNATYYDLGYDDPTRAGGAVTYLATETPPDARLSAAHPARHYVGYVTTAAAGGVQTGGGGAVPPGGGYCVTADSLVFMADGSWKPAGDLRRGDRVRTRSDDTLAWGDFTVTAVSTVREQIMRAPGYPDATAEHRFWIDGDGWFRMESIGTSAGWADVVRITVPGARTYVARHPEALEGVLSHNIKQQDQNSA